jgi:hypothetical protein
LTSGFYASLVYAEQINTPSALADSQQKYLECYNAARTAETAGANISRLTAILNQAGVLISSAQIAFANGDSALGNSLCVQSDNLLNNIGTEANSIKAIAVNNQRLDFLVNIVGSIVGTIGVIGGSFAVWIFLKRRYGSVGVEPNESSKV